MATDKEITAAIGAITAKVRAGSSYDIKPWEAAELANEMDRRGAVIERLEQKIARSDAILKDVRRLLVRCHDRIHSLPRTSDTELATSIGQLLRRIASELGAPHND